MVTKEVCFYIAPNGHIDRYICPNRETGEGQKDTIFNVICAIMV